MFDFTRWRTTPRWLIGVILLGYLSTIGFAQDNNDEVRVTTELSRSSVYVGDDVSYQIIVKGSTNPMPPEVMFPDLVRAQFHGRTSQSFTTQRIINGVRRSVTERSFIFQYTLTAMGEGEIVIPAPTVVVEGVTHTGDTAAFQALLPSRSYDDEVEILIERTEVYLNETVEAECVWWIADQTSEFNFSASSFPDSFVLRPTSQNTTGQYQVDFILNGQSMSGTVETDTRNGRQMSRFSFRISITPSELGEYELGPLRAIFTRHSGTGSRFRAFAESEMIPIRVLSVPIEGRPKNYRDAIGEFELSSRASNTRVNVGDPIQLTLRIRGQEPMLGANTPPDLNSDPDFTERFKLDSAGWREITPRTTGNRAFETTVRAIDDRVTQIPSVKLPSFNPTLGAYKIYQTDPIPLEVMPVKEITLADAIIRGSEITSSTTVRPSIDRIELTTASPGLWAHSTASDIAHESRFSLEESVTNPIWQVMLGTPPLLYIASLSIVHYRRNRNESLHRMRTTFLASKKLHGIAALRRYLSGVLEIDYGAVSAIDAYQLPINVTLQRECYEAMLESEYVEPRDALTQANDLLLRIHRDCIKNYRKEVA